MYKIDTLNQIRKKKDIEDYVGLSNTLKGRIGIASYQVKLTHLQAHLSHQRLFGKGCQTDRKCIHFVQQLSESL